MNPISTCARGEEKFETFKLHFGRRPTNAVQYDYRHTNGRLFSCVRPTLEKCRAARDAWVLAGAR